MRFVAEITLTVSGSAQTFYVASSGWTTRPTDTPASTHIAGRLLDAGSLSRSLFSGARVAGATRPAFGMLRIVNADGALDAWAGYAAGGGKVLVRMGDEDAAYPAGYTTVYIAYVKRLVCTMRDIEIHLRDRSDLLDRPFLTRGFAGTGGFEGTTGVSGRLRQWVSEAPGYIEPQMVDVNRQLYFVHSTQCYPGGRGAHKVYEGGVEIAREADYASSSDCWSTAPTPGKARYLFDTDGVWFRIAAPPVYDLRCFAYGQMPGGSAWNAVALAAQAGIAGGTGTLGVTDILVDDDRTYLEVLTDAAAAIGWFGMTRLDAFRCGTLAAPSGSPVYEFTQHNARGWSRGYVPGMEEPVWRVTLNGGQTWPSNIAAAAPDTMIEALTRSPWQSSSVVEDAAILAANPGALHAVVETRSRRWTGPASIAAFAATYLGLFGVRRSLYTCEVPMTAATLALELHDTVQIKLPRFGASSGVLARVVQQEIRCAERRIRYGLWA